MDPDEVADKVVTALRSDQFLILTHDAYPQLLMDRVAALVERRLPAVPEFPERRPEEVSPERGADQAVVAMPPSTGMMAPVR